MKSPKGFGRTYFRLSAILAYTMESKLNANKSSITSLENIIDDFNKFKEIEDDEPIDDLIILNSNSCQCSIFANIKTKLSLTINIFIPRCQYYNRYFAFRRTGVHPPKFY